MEPAILCLQNRCGQSVRFSQAPHVLIKSLSDICTNKTAALALAKELLGGKLRFSFLRASIRGHLSDTRESRQGAPESGPLFNLALSHHIKAGSGESGLEKNVASACLLFQKPRRCFLRMTLCFFLALSPKESPCLRTWQKPWPL